MKRKKVEIHMMINEEFENAFSPIFVTLLNIKIVFNKEPAKLLLFICSIDPSILTSLRLFATRNAYSSIVATLSGIVIFRRFEHCANVPGAMVSMLLGNTIVSKFQQLAKAYSPIEVILSCRLISLKASQS